MYILKQIPEDFIVKEITNIVPKNEGNFSYWILKKQNYTTIRAIEHIAAKLNIPVKYIGFAGNKDKKAITTQLISIKGTNHEKISNLSLKDISLEFFGNGNSPISLGDLIGNQFTITVRNIKQPPKPINKMLNIFGEQRFSKNNAQIGKAILKGNYKLVLDLIKANNGDIEETVLSHIEKKTNDYIGAIRTINKKILRLYIHSYQSEIWNKAAIECKFRKIETKSIPVPGFGTEFNENNPSHKIIQEIMSSENICSRDFIIRACPELSSEGCEREMYTSVDNLVISKLSFDELNPAKQKCIIEFALKKGSYATITVAQMFEDTKHTSS